MSPAATAQCRLSFWLRPGAAESFAAAFARQLLPLLEARGLSEPRPCERAQADGVFSRVFALADPGQLPRLQRALDESWNARLRRLAAAYAPAGERQLRYHLGPYSEVAEPQAVQAGGGYHQGLWHSFDVQDGLPSSQIVGMLWSGRHLWLLASPAALCRYDGHHFTTFSHSGNKRYDFSSHILQRDASGHLWIAAPAGLCRFDGERFSFYTCADGLPTDGVAALLVDGRGHLWCRHEGGQLSRFDGERFDAIALDIGAVEHMAADGQGALWFCGEQGLCRYDGQFHTWGAGECGLPRQGPFSHVLAGGRGQLFCAAPDGIYARRGERFFCCAPADPPAPARLLAADEQGALWFCRNDVLCHFDGERCAECLSGDIVSALSDGEGRMWFAAANNGVFAFDGCSFAHYTTRDGLGHNRVIRMLGEGHGRVWFATWGGGLCRYDGHLFTYFTSANGLPHDEVEGIGRDRDGHMWFATRGGGLCRYDGQNFRHYGCADGLPHEWVWSVWEDVDGQLLFGTSGNRFARFDGERFHAVDVQVDCSIVWSFCRRRDGRLWVGTNLGGAICLEGDRLVEVLTAGDGLPHSIVWDICEDRRGALWLATWQGACRYGDGVLELFAPDSGLAAANIWTLYEDRDGRMWFGTWGDGAYCYDGQQLRHYARADGLADDNVRAIYQDERGHMWFGTYGGGLCRYDGQVFTRLSRKDGLIHDAVQDIVQSRDGAYWIATEGGVTCYRPPRTPPSIHLDGVVADRRYEIGEAITIAAGQQLIAFEFHGASFTTAPDQFAYVYRLRGLEEEWRTAYTGRVEYTDLPGGTYTFEVRAVDRDLNYSAAASLALTIAPDLHREHIAALQAQLSQAHELDPFIGRSAALQEALEQIHTVAATDVTALILGETGTGKGLAARAIHDLSPRREQPFIQVNCGAIPEGLIESELFGHEKGAFTGAISRKIGRFELADGGTIFLDEIGDLPLQSQQVLLQVLQEGILQRVGGQEQIRVDVRVVAATNRDLRQAMRAGHFREDLYFRLGAFVVHLPPLRQRREDVPLLMHYFVEKFARHLHRPTPEIEPQVLSYLQQYAWPGNVRELEHIAQRALLVCQGGRIRRQDIPGLEADVHAARAESGPRLLPLEEAERELICTALRACEGIVYGERGAARLLGIHPEKLRAKMRKHGIKKSAF